MDKLLHFIMNFGVVYFLGDINIFLGISIALVLSIGKELYDKFNGNKIDLKDLLFDALGIISGIVIVTLK